MVKPIAITGGVGFLAHGAVRYLAEHGRGAALLDRHPPPAHRPAEAPLVLGDVRDAEAVDRLVRDASAVIHYAAVVGVNSYLSNTAEVIDVNLNGTRLVLQACLRYDKPVLFASTSEVYGRNCERLREDSASVFGCSASARWSYAVSKSAGEHLARALARDGLRCVITRYFNAYGPLMDQPGSGRVISKFIGKLTDEQPLQLVDGGAAVRCFCYVDDTVRGTVELLFALERGELRSGLAFNIGRDEPVSMRELAELLLQLAGRPKVLEDVAGIDAFGAGFEDVPRRVPDLAAIRGAIGFEARVDLESGLARVLDHWGLRRPSAHPTPRLSAARRAEPAPHALKPPVVPMLRPQFEPTLALGQDLLAILESGRVSNDGPQVAAFERQLARQLDVERVVCVSSGSSALDLTARVFRASLAEPAGAQVVLPAFTYIATLAAFVHAGFEPLLCDIEAESFTLDVDCVERILRAHPKVCGVVAVNTYGVPPAIERLAELAQAHGASLILDNAHALGTQTDRALGARGAVLAATYSLHATKTLPAVEGGLVVSSDPRFLDHVARLRAHGWASDRLESTPGFNARLDELRARIGLEQLARFEETLARRRAYAARLRQFAERQVPGFFTPQVVPAGVKSNFQNLALRCQVPDGSDVADVSAEFLRHGVEARRYFDPPLHQLAQYRGRFDLPNTDAVYASLLCLPLHDHMSEPTLQRVEAALRATAQTFGR